MLHEQGGPVRWFKAARSGYTNCVEVAHLAAETRVRDTKQHDLIEQPLLLCSPEAWSCLEAEFRGESPFGSNGEIAITATNDGGQLWRSTASGVELRFTADEIDAFRGGVVDGEFSRSLVFA